MDSINALKGYNKVGELENNRASLNKARKRLIIAICSLVVLTAVIIISIVCATLSPDDTAEDSTSDSMIKALCNATQHPNSCLSSLSPLTSSSKSDPEELFKLSLQISVNELSKLSSVPKNLIAKVNEKGAQTALRDCQSLIEDAVDRVNKSIKYMEVGAGEKVLNESKINDIRTWLSGAITNQETCLDGLEEMNSGVRDEMKAAMKNSMEFTGNSLAIVTKIQEIVQDLHVPLHRKLLGFAVEMSGAMN